jgi:hypothetical protein
LDSCNQYRDAFQIRLNDRNKPTNLGSPGYSIAQTAQDHECLFRLGIAGYCSLHLDSKGFMVLGKSGK